MMPLFSAVIRPQSILPESSSMNSTLGSTELLRNNGESEIVPGADQATTGLISAHASKDATGAVLDIGLFVPVMIIAPFESLEYSTVIAAKNDLS